MAHADECSRRHFFDIGADDLFGGCQKARLKTKSSTCLRGQELIIDTINTAFGTPFKRHYVQIKQNFGEKWAYPNGV